MNETPDGLIVCVRQGDVEVAEPCELHLPREVDVHRTTGSIVIESDPVGLHRIFVGRTGDSAAVGTSQAGVARALPTVSVDPNAVSRSLADWRRDPTRTLFREIRAIPAGSRLAIDTASGALATESIE